MDGSIVVKHSIGGIEHLSLLSSPHMSPKETISLPFNDEDDQSRGSSCNGLFFLDNFTDNSVICNLTTNQLKPLTPRHPDNSFTGSGLGYDPISDDYKVVRDKSSNPDTAEVYSLKSHSWKVITGPGDDVRLGPECGIYLDGRCYWVVYSFKPEVGVRDFILCFDFTQETFSRIPLPPALRPPRAPLSPPPPILPGELESKFKLNVFDCDGFLGVVGYKRLEDHKSRVAKHFELWVSTGGGSWARSFSVILLDVERPLGLRDGRFMFLEGNSSCGQRHLMVYDWVKEELREHDFCDIPPSRLLLLSYVENRVVLPGAKPLINGALARGKVLKRCRHREKVHAEHSVLKRCRRRQEKTLKKCGSSTSTPASK